jgi:hypothetical protein
MLNVSVAVDVLINLVQPQLSGDRVHADAENRADDRADAKTRDEYVQIDRASGIDVPGLAIPIQSDCHTRKYAQKNLSLAIQPMDKHPPTTDDSRQNVRHKPALETVWG